MARLLGNAACLGLLSVVVADTSLETRSLEMYVMEGWMSVVPGGVLEINLVSSQKIRLGFGGKRQPFFKTSLRQ